jgi:uncharacterized protein DUF6516
LNDAYISRIRERIEALGTLSAHHDLQIRRPGPQVLGIRVRVRFKDGFRFEGNEIWFPAGRKYRFHLMDAGGSLLWRLDNAPHHREVATHPDHLHLPGEAVEEAAPITLEDALLALGHRGPTPPRDAKQS